MRCKYCNEQLVVNNWSDTMEPAYHSKESMSQCMTRYATGKISKNTLGHSIGCWHYPSQESIIDALLDKYK